MKLRFVKLVRDHVHSLIGDCEVVYEPIRDREEALKALRYKVVEEALEFAMNPTIEELGDVYEAVRCIADLDPAMVSHETVIMAANAKRRERGGFAGMVGMYVRRIDGDDHL